MRDLTIPVGEHKDGFLALEQSILIAQKESASLRGLHVLPAKSELDTPKAKARC